VVAASAVLAVFATALPARAGTGDIETFAGGGAGAGRVATSFSIASPRGVALDAAGNLFISDASNHRVLKVDAQGLLSTVAGNGECGSSGDGGAATAAAVCAPAGLALDAAGNLYIALPLSHKVRMVSPTGVITTVAGTGFAGPLGNPGPATQRSLDEPVDVVVASTGRLYIADARGKVVYGVEPTGYMFRIAGWGRYGDRGDGGDSVNATLREPRSVAVDRFDDLYIADRADNRIRKVEPGTGRSGRISTVAGGGSGGDGGPAILASLQGPEGVDVDPFGNIYIADSGNNRVRKVSAGLVITTVAGNGQSHHGGDGWLASVSSMYSPDSVAVDGTGRLFIGIQRDHRVRMVSHDLMITTVAGNGDVAYGGDGGPATQAALYAPHGMAFDAAGNLFIADAGNNRVRRVSTDGTILTWAGNGQFAYSGDGSGSPSAALRFPTDVAVDGAGNIFIADSYNNRVRKVSAAGFISTVAGMGDEGFSGDGGPATAAKLSRPWSVAVDPAGNLFIADSGNNRVRRVSTDGTISTVAGSGAAGFSGDGGPATSALLKQPLGVAVDAAGNLFIADAGNRRVRRVSTDGTVSTVAGDGSWGYRGDGGPATAAALHPLGVEVDAQGSLFIADPTYNVVRRVSASGTISTVAGTGSSGFSGDGAPATGASLSNPSGVTVDETGSAYIADTGNNRVRRVIG